MSKDNFDFLNSQIWLKYTQERYLPLDDIKYRLEGLDILKEDWSKIRQQILSFRKMGAVVFDLGSIGKTFWYYPSDCIYKKLYQIEKLGFSLLNQIENHGTLKNEFINYSLIEEAVTSSIYEGVNSTRTKAKELIAIGNQAKDKDEQMLINNYKTMQWIKKNFSLPISNKLILRIHEMITDKTLEEGCGQFRDDVVYIGKHEGIPYNQVTKALEEVTQMITDHPRLLNRQCVLIQSILFHYFVAYIHPFFDGNGRSARALFYLSTMKNNLKFVEMLSISAGLKHGSKYERSFELVKKHEFDLTYFIDFCLDLLVFALHHTHRRVAYLKDILRLIDVMGMNYHQVTLLQKMTLNKYKPITIEKYAEDINKSRELARKDLKELVKKELLREDKKGKKHVYYIQSQTLSKKLKISY